MALAAQALEAQKADKPLEQGGALEQVAARIERVMGLTDKVSGPQNAGPLERRVRHCAIKNRATCARYISARAQKHLNSPQRQKAKPTTATAPQRRSA